MTQRTFIEPEAAQKLILAGEPLGNVTINGGLDLSGETKLKQLPDGLKAFQLDASETSLESLPNDIEVECGIVLRDCPKLVSLPKRLKTGTLDLRNCEALTELPEGLNVWFLDIQGCRSLTGFPKRATIENGELNLRGLSQIRALPNYVKRLSTLDISDCPQITSLSSELKIGLWIDVAGSGLIAVPPSLKGIGLRWRGVPVDERIAFRPETITSKEILDEKNAEVRRVKIEQMGIEKYIADVGAKTLNRDTDPGGKRELLRIKLEGTEDIVCLSCSCPSTGRRYFLRVPPTMKTCHQAAAWMAGFDDPKKYNPVIET